MKTIVLFEVIIPNSIGSKHFWVPVTKSVSWTVMLKKYIL